MKHKHYDLILEYIEDTTQIIQQQNDITKEWFDLERVGFFEDKTYRMKNPNVNQVIITQPNNPTYFHKVGKIVGQDGEWTLIEFKDGHVYSFKEDSYKDYNYGP